jgi:uncharacterized protein (TIGR04255 family)
MASKILKKKPLIEAILEARWGPQMPGTIQTPGASQLAAPNVQFDPHYKILLGRLYDRVQTEYPFHEQLPTASIADWMAPQVVQYRFRTRENEWPLLQVGPGIFTVNETSKYVWQDFRVRASTAIGKLFDAHPKPAELKIENLVLRYINAVDFDYSSQSVFSFLKEKMRISVGLPNELFNPGVVQSNPNNFSWQTNFPCNKPKGIVSLRFDTALKENNPVLSWHTMVLSSGSEVPEMPGRFDAWFEAAHDVQDDWFFKLIAGELETSFDQ